jgi:hypothetical protein
MLVCGLHVEMCCRLTSPRENWRIAGSVLEAPACICDRGKGHPGPAPH